MSSLQERTKERARSDQHRKQDSGKVSTGERKSLLLPPGAATEGLSQSGAVKSLWVRVDKLFNFSLPVLALQ